MLIRDSVEGITFYIFRVTEILFLVLRRFLNILFAMKHVIRGLLNRLRPIYRDRAVSILSRKQTLPLILMCKYEYVALTFDDNQSEILLFFIRRIM